MYFIKRNTFFDSAYKFVRLYSSSKKTHYEVLNLQKNCTDKDIKNAFIQMSKEYHPDKNKNEKAQENFVRIVEAYNVLGKPSSRAQYDQISHLDNQNTYSYVYKTHTPYNWRTTYNGQSNYQNYNEKTNSYYGVKGWKKMSNTDLILICFGIAVVGVILQVVIIRESYHIHRKKNDDKSIKLAEELEKVRATARGKTRDMQTQVLLDKIVTAANPSVATASLGQTLADDKK
ncbi:dnaJ-like protein 60 [Vanessa tameamea]|uniref:DnaJ-like protein 60 n=1 Tax=Vanessa tameamea TaxID=334116 RepID=A0A8B8IAD4_VANTA|nr:dnaJ-like protein 60 [Vanessa tameamea]